MLWHYRKRAEECASRVNNTRSEAVRQNYQRLLESWNALIEAEEARLSRMANAPQQGTRAARHERPRLELVRASHSMAPILDRPVA
jgi:exonuclease VII large subunit